MVDPDGRLTRRQLIGGAALILGTVAAFSAPPIVGAMPADQFSDLENRYNVRIGLFAANLGAQTQIAWRDGDRFALCSSFKAYAAGRVLQGVDRRQLQLATPVPIVAGDILPNSPVTEPAVGRTLSLGELCAAAVQQSDNAAANLLLRNIGGPSAITAFARELGDGATRLDRWETELNTAIPGDDRDTTTPAGVAAGFREMLTGQALSASSRTQLIDWMKANVTSTMRAGLPPGWTTADKTGSGDYGSTNDIGVAYGPNGETLLLAIMTRSRADDPNVPNNRQLIGELTTAVLPMVL